MSGPLTLNFWSVESEGDGSIRSLIMVRSVWSRAATERDVSVFVAVEQHLRMQRSRCLVK